jgi:hypothetical protein
MNEVSYGWAPLSEADARHQVPEAYRLAELFEGTLYTIPINGKAITDRLSLFSLNNSAIRCVAMYHSPGGTFIRFLNVASDPQTVLLDVHQPAPKLRTANMDEKLGEELSPVKSAGGTSSYSIEFGANQLVTLCLA